MYLWGAHTLSRQFLRRYLKPEAVHGIKAIDCGKIDMYTAVAGFRGFHENICRHADDSTSTFSASGAAAS